MLFSSRYLAAVALFLLTSTAAAVPVPESNNVARSTELNEVARGVGVKEWIRSGPSEVDARASKDWKRDEVEARGPPMRDWRRGLSSGGKDWRRASGGDTGKDWKRGLSSGGKDWRRASGGDTGKDWKRGLSSGGKDWRRASGGDTGKDWKRDDEVDTRASKDW